MGSMFSLTSTALLLAGRLSSAILWLAALLFTFDDWPQHETVIVWPAVVKLVQPASMAAIVVPASYSLLYGHCLSFLYCL
jgi:hypothetical protein